MSAIPAQNLYTNTKALTDTASDDDFLLEMDEYADSYEADAECNDFNPFDIYEEAAETASLALEAFSLRDVTSLSQNDDSSLFDVPIEETTRVFDMSTETDSYPDSESDYITINLAPPKASHIQQFKNSLLATRAKLNSMYITTKNTAQKVSNIFSTVSSVFSKIGKLIHPRVAQALVFILSIVLFKLVAALVVIVSQIVLMAGFAFLITSYLTSGKSEDVARSSHDYMTNVVCDQDI